MKTVGSRIRHVRTQKGLTLEALAKKSKLSRSFLWDVEQDRSNVGGDSLLRIANALGASLDFLLRGGPVPEDYRPMTVEIPRELSEFAETEGLSYRQTLALLEVHTAIVARRSTKARRPPPTRDDWKDLWQKLRNELEGSDDKK